MFYDSETSLVSTDLIRTSKWWHLVLLGCFAFIHKIIKSLLPIQKKSKHMDEMTLPAFTRSQQLRVGVEKL